ncbi:tetratricopeptide repeat protein [Mycobacterium sp. CBMA271]|uniref:tetratricopeptide repeat protein n=1 Tax=unclassified Mycobacteroides TaxID=2618759 RepID=UPI0012DD65B8|nr:MULTISPECIES: tetratricopeptide repeat protein [unclassified Mycobacteroides]MUM19705.1 hypothetical protein [Mycobacteroides sp. CBMA 326]MUM24309.1 tetratricopeptide repeat protein [Mycobacteroides sp. CBMA 271]
MTLERDSASVLATVQAYLDTDRPERARELLRGLLVSEPENTEALWMLALAESSLKNYVASERCLDAFLAVKPDAPEGWRLRAANMIELSHVDRALSAARRAVELSPHWATAYSTLSDALSKNGQEGEALAAARKALELEPDSSYRFGVVGDRLPSKQRAFYYRKALKAGPDSAIAHWDMAWHLSPPFAPMGFEGMRHAMRAVQLDKSYAPNAWRLISEFVSREFFYQRLETLALLVCLQGSFPAPGHVSARLAAFVIMALMGCRVGVFVFIARRHKALPIVVSLLRRRLLLGSQAAFLLVVTVSTAVALVWNQARLGGWCETAILVGFIGFGAASFASRWGGSAGFTQSDGKNVVWDNGFWAGMFLPLRIRRGLAAEIAAAEHSALLDRRLRNNVAAVLRRTSTIARLPILLFMLFSANAIDSLPSMGPWQIAGLAAVSAGAAWVIAWPLIALPRGALPIARSVVTKNGRYLFHAVVIAALFVASLVRLGGLGHYGWPGAGMFVLWVVLLLRPIPEELTDGTEHG